MRNHISMSLGRLAAAQNGVALIIVLGALVLLSGLTLAFFASVTTERRAVENFAGNTNARMLAESGVNLVMSQILDASSNPGVAWASQPGMIKTFDDQGKGFLAYKLYSASEMREDISSPSTNPIANDLPAPGSNWIQDEEQWVDLNGPVSVDGIAYYPIVHPGALQDDPATTADEKVAGFDVEPTWLMDTNGDGELDIPMPVRWLYVLADGSMKAAAGSSVPGVNPTNKIVGRIAFWADDETSKVNINTAAEGTFWDVPRGQLLHEKEGTVATFGPGALALNQPRANEWQRYPGHPATTALSPVLFGSVDPNESDREITKELTPGQKEELYTKIVPRVEAGGSKGGTEVVPLGGAALPVNPDEDRLYATFDELIFRTQQNERDDQDQDFITASKLERSRFFLTANSRAPEINLWNKPRVAIWPIDSTAANRTLLDRVIAFASTLGGSNNPEPFYFQRRDAASPTNDWTNIVRNQELFNYLMDLTSSPVPGFGGSFETKYPDDRAQILTQIFDYIRSTNLHDDYLAEGQTFTNTRGTAGHGQVTPISIAAHGTQGFGRFMTISEVAVLFMSANQSGTEGQMVILLEPFFPAQGWMGIDPEVQIQVSGLNSFAINGSRVFAQDSATISNYETSEKILQHVRSYGGTGDYRSLMTQGSYPLISNKFSMSGSTLSFSGGTLALTISNSQNDQDVQELQVTFPAINNLQKPTPITEDNVPFDKNGRRDTNNVGSWQSASGRIGQIKGGGNSPLITKSGGAIVFGKGSFIQEADVVHSMVAIDPRLVAARQSVGSGDGLFVQHDRYGMNKDTNNDGMLAGDKVKMAHGLTISFGRYHVPGSVHSDFIKDVALDREGKGGRPDIPLQAVALAAQATGDWDNGVGRVPDGAYINKPDEGNVNRNQDKGRLLGVPYYDKSGEQDSDESFFSPNRQVASAGMFGSLPTGVKSGVPYRTLLFRPDLGSGHFGATSPPDHIILDLFQMPVVEPYPISEPFSTAGKINLNYAIAPFDYIERSTGIHALLKNERVSAISNIAANVYKWSEDSDVVAKAGYSERSRFPINMRETLRGFERVLGIGGFSGQVGPRIFRSASEICEVPIVPFEPGGASWTLETMSDFWEGHQATGDNMKERPYTTIYPRVTTKSNTFTVHVIAQTLKGPGMRTGNVDMEVDQVTGEYRGAFLIERFLDPNETTFDITNPTAVLGPYKFRIVNVKQFNP